MYKPAAHWLWDFWLAHDGRQHHLFYLQAPDSLPDAEQRHVNARIGHAVSADLCHWRELGQVLGPDEEGQWDDRCTWTGSVVASHQQATEQSAQQVDQQTDQQTDQQAAPAAYAMLYTGTNWREGGRIQRIGLAWSDDLHRWRRHQPSLVLEHSAQHYLGGNPVHDDEQAWRDPHVEYVPQRQCYTALITAQVADQAHGHGCIALSESTDLVHWRVLPPIYQSPAFFLMEIPQQVHINGHYYLLFSAMAQWIKPQLLAPECHALAPLTGTYYVHGDNPTGPWQFGGRLCGHHERMEYGLKLVAHQGEWFGLYWRGYGANGDFCGDLSDPLRVHQDRRGLLRLGD